MRFEYRGKLLGLKLRNLKKVLQLRLQDEATNTPESTSPK